MSFIDFACSNLLASLIIASGLFAFIVYDNNYEWTNDSYCKSLACLLFVPFIFMFSLIPALHLLIIIPFVFNFYGIIVLAGIIIQRMMIALHDACSHKHEVNERYAYAVKHDACDEDMHVSNMIDYNEDSTDYSERIIS